MRACRTRDYWAHIVSALVLGAGTEGANTALKYFGYVKDARRTDPAVSPPVDLSIVPPTISLRPGDKMKFNVVHRSGGEASAKWIACEPNGGTIDAAGVYTAPAAAGSYHVMAMSQDDPSVLAIASVTVQ